MLLGREVFLEKGGYQVHLLFLYGHELLHMLLFVVAMLLLVVLHLFIHGLHEGVQADAMIYRLFRCFGGWNRRTRWRRRSC